MSASGTPNFDSDDVRRESDHDALGALESALNSRGRQLSSRVGMVGRIERETLPIIRSRKSRRVLVSSSAAFRWGAGLSMAALLAVAFVLTPSQSERSDGARASSVVASTDSGGTVAEPVLVSLIAGSETIPAGPEVEFEFDHASAMSILRTRDASFGDLDSEVKTILASAVNR